MYSSPNLFRTLLCMALIVQQLLLPTAWAAATIGNSGSAVTICSTSGLIPQDLLSASEERLLELEGTAEAVSAPHCSLCAHLSGSPLPDEIQLVGIAFSICYSPVSVAKKQPVLSAHGPPLGLRAPPIA